MINRLRRGFDPGFLVVLLICLLAIWPFISRASLPEGTDAELHIFRLHELSYLIRGGEFYPRWAPNFYHGYGYPIFNYYAPLTYYLALPLELLPRIDAVLASKAVLVGAMLLAGLGIYGYTRDLWGRRAGFVAAALYVYAPYIQYIDPHIRGVIPEALSFGVFPWALWSLDRVRRRPTPAAWIASGIAVAAVILSHNLMGLFFFGLLAAWVAWQAVLVWREQRGQGELRESGGEMTVGSIVRPLGALLLGLGLASFFWLPVFLERNAVNLETLIGAGDNYDFRTHFLALSELLSFSQPPDWAATQPQFLFNLGVAQWVGGLLGVVMWFLGRARARGQLAFFAIAAAVVIFLMTSASKPVWEVMPFLPYFQFPWRLLGVAAALLAILGAAGVEALVTGKSRRARDMMGASEIPESHRRSTLFYTAAIALPIVFALPLSQLAPWAPFGEANTLRMSLIENSGRWLGTTSTADYVPATVIMLPERRGTVVAPLAEGLPPDRVNWEAMPEGTVVTAENVRPLLIRYHVEAPKQFRLRLYLFDFPGWRVTVDGVPATTELAEPEGFIVVLVPQGEHVVEVRFGSTLPRTVGWLLAGLSVVGLVAGAFWLGKTGAKPAPSTMGYPRERFSDWPIVATIGGLIAVVLLIQPLGLFHHQSQGRQLDVPATQQYANFGDQIALLGYHINEDTFNPGDTVNLTLYWQALRALDIDYQAFVHILDANGELVAQSDKLNPGEFPTRRWPLDRYVSDQYRIALPPTLPPGVYTVAAGIWVQSEGWRLPLFDESGQSIGDRLELFSLRVK